jgi:hypothetical protein
MLERIDYGFILASKFGEEKASRAPIPVLGLQGNGESLAAMATWRCRAEKRARCHSHSPFPLLFPLGVGSRAEGPVRGLVGSNGPLPAAAGAGRREDAEGGRRFEEVDTVWGFSSMETKGKVVIARGPDLSGGKSYIAKVKRGKKVRSK